MNQAIFKEILPEDYIERYTKENIREDGRSFEQFRSIKVMRKNEVTLLSLGQTLVMASTEIQKYEDKQVNSLVSQMKQLIEVDVKMNIGQHGSSELQSTFDLMKSESYYSQYLQNIINKNYNGLSAICQITKEIPNLYWDIKLNLRVVNNDGNLHDALILAAQFELFNCQVNEVVVKTIDGGLIVEEIQDKRRYLQFNIENFLFPVQCSLLSNDIILFDPSNYEQEHSQTNVQIIISLNEKTCSLNKLGGRDINLDGLNIIHNKAESLVKSKTEFLYDLLNTHKSEFTI